MPIFLALYARRKIKQLDWFYRRWDGLHAKHFLDEISREVDPGSHAIIVFDRAAWHTTKKLHLPKNISLLPLPPASPDAKSNRTSMAST